MSEARQVVNGIGPWLIGVWGSGLVGQASITLAVVVVCGLVFWLAHAAEQTDAVRLKEPAQPRATDPKPFRTGKSRPRGPVFIPLVVGNVTVDLQPTVGGTIHTIIDGTSGMGKSTLLVQLLDLPIGVVFLSLDNCRPIQERIDLIPDGIHWTNERDWPVALNLLGPAGSPADIAAEGVVAGFPKSAGDKGTYRRYAMERLEPAIEAMDAAGTPRRIVPELVQALLVPPPGQPREPDADRACASWAPKLRGLANHLGGSIGPGVDIADAMRNRQKLLIRVNRFRRPEWAPFVGGMALVHLRRAIDEVDVPFLVVVEEAGQLEEYQEMMSPIGQAARDRGKPLIVLTQNPSKLPQEVTNNTKVWISFPHEDKLEAANMAHHLRLNADQLLIESFPLLDKKRPSSRGVGWCYVRAPGIETHLQRVKLPRPPSKLPMERQASPQPIPLSPIPPTADAEAPESPLSPPAPPAPIVAPPESEVPLWALSGGELAMRVWLGRKSTGEPCPLWSPTLGTWWDERGCDVWTGSTTYPKPGQPVRPRIRHAKRDYTPYREVVRARGDNPDPTVDHLCGNPMCVKSEHLEGGVSIVDNQTRNEPRRIAFELAWEERLGALKGESPAVTAQALAAANAAS